MVFLRCEAVRWVDDEPQPGLIEVRFTDAHHQQWAFIDKWPVFAGGDDLSPDSRYPAEVSILCDILTTGTSRSSLPPLNPPTPLVRARPTASSSSMKTIAGAFSFASLNRSRTRAAPTPTIA